MGTQRPLSLVSGQLPDFAHPSSEGLSRPRLQRRPFAAPGLLSNSPSAVCLRPSLLIPFFIACRNKLKVRIYQIIFLLIKSLTTPYSPTIEACFAFKAVQTLPTRRCSLRLPIADRLWAKGFPTALPARQGLARRAAARPAPPAASPPVLEIWTQHHLLTLSTGFMSLE